MRATSPNINRYWADLVVEEFLRIGVSHFFLAPGSRNAPLATAVAENERARQTMHYDERGTCFLALGSGKRTGLPAVWITTSGTAVANGLPAVVEASQSCVPLILLTADRPFELRDVGANQAIEQPGIFGNYVRWSTDLPAPTSDIRPEAILTTVDQAFARSVGPPAGPVHVNMPFREPLAPAEVDFSIDNSGIRRWLAGADPFTSFVRSPVSVAETELGQLRSSVERSKRGVFVIGGLADRPTADRIVSLAEAWQWPILADVTSQSRLGSESDLIVDAPHFVAKHSSPDAPDVVIRFGSQISSKPINGLLKSWQPEILAAISDDPRRQDAGHSVTHKVSSHPAEFCAAAESWQTSPDDSWPAKWKGYDVAAVLDTLIDESAEVSEPGIARRITQITQSDQVLYLAGSMPVRDFDMFADGSGAPAWVGANRGASGIDGTIASAVGAASSTNQQATIVVGDLALLHDLNSLSLLKGRSDIVVVLNNDGGGIFSFLPIAEHPDVFEPLFGTPHGLSFESAAAMFGLRYVRPQTMRTFSEAYRGGLTAQRSTIIEIVTDRDENRALHLRLDDRIAALF